MDESLFLRRRRCPLSPSLLLLIASLLLLWSSVVASAAGTATFVTNATQPSPDSSKPPFAVFGYLPEYRQQRFDYEAFFRSGLTHLIFFSAEVDPTTLKLIHVDDRLPSPEQWAAVRALADAYGVKLLLCVGGGGRSGGFAKLVESVLGRRRFIQQLYRVVEERGLDGVDLNWEYPASITEWLNLGQFLSELRTHAAERRSAAAPSAAREAPSSGNQTPAQPLLLTMALHPHPSIPHVLRSSRVLPSLDYLHWMAYDHIVPDDGHSSVSYAASMLQPSVIGSLDDALYRAQLAERRQGKAAQRGAGAASAPERQAGEVDHRRKLCLGIPFYGRHREDHRLGPETYEHLWQFIRQWARKRHPDWAVGGPELRSLSNYAGYDFNGYDDVKRKMRLARTMGVGGIMIWELGQDVPPGTSPMSLMSAVGEQLAEWGAGPAGRRTTVETRGGGEGEGNGGRGATQGAASESPSRGHEGGVDEGEGDL